MTLELTMDGLAARNDEELLRIFEHGATPDLAALDGDLQGRVLAVRRLDRRPWAGAVRSLARDTAFPWGGKSFSARGEREGEGINRVSMLGQHRLFPFRTCVGPSVVDGAPAVILDYGSAVNPAWIRAVHDELREIAPGLFLGPACIKQRNERTRILWFALKKGNA